MSIGELLKNNPIIAAVEYQDLDMAVKSNTSAVVLMNGTLSNLIGGELEIYNRKKPIFIHTDLLRGLSHDKEAIKFLHRHIKVAGIVSTKSTTLRAAKKIGLLTIQRTFLIDTRSFLHSIESIKENNPDAIEIMPGISPSIVKRFRQKIDKIPIILSGLITEEKQIYEGIEAGADGISMSKSDLWNIYKPKFKRG